MTPCTLLIATSLSDMIDLMYCHEFIWYRRSYELSRIHLTSYIFWIVTNEYDATQLMSFHDFIRCHTSHELTRIHLSSHNLHHSIKEGMQHQICLLGISSNISSEVTILPIFFLSDLQCKNAGFSISMLAPPSHDLFKGLYLVNAMMSQTWWYITHLWHRAL